MVGRIVEVPAFGQPGLVEEQMRQVVEMGLVRFDAFDQGVFGVDLENRQGLRRLLAEGGQLDDPAAYVKRVNALLLA